MRNIDPSNTVTSGRATSKTAAVSAMVPAILILVLALVAAAGSQSFLGPCIHEDGSAGACTQASRAVLGVGILLAAQSLLALLAGRKNGSIAAGVYLSMILTAVLGIVLPGGLIPLCGMATMRCRALMRPAMTILFVLCGLLSALGLWLSCARKNRN